MHDEIREAVVSVALNIFETMFFIFLDPIEVGTGTEDQTGMPGKDSPSGASDTDSWVIRSEIPFSGFHAGRLQIVLPYELGQLMTKNFLGFEEEVKEDQILDMGSELANMVCGNLFSLLDKKSVFSLGSPTTEKIPSGEKGRYLHPEDLVLEFITEGNPVTIVVQLVQVQSS